jgi:MFS family permease
MLGRLPYTYAVAVVAVLALFMDLLDMTILNVALPTIGREVGADTAALQWSVTGYLLSLAVACRSS